jgi:hypothetical protein
MHALTFALLLATQAAAPTPPAPTPKPTASRPTPASRGKSASAPVKSVPDQPYVGTPRPVDKPYEVILKAKESGTSNKALLEKVRREKVVYSLTTYDIQKLRAAGVSPDVIEAMMRSGRAKTTPEPKLPSAPAPTGGTPAPTPR